MGNTIMNEVEGDHNDDNHVHHEMESSSDGVDLMFGGHSIQSSSSILNDPTEASATLFLRTITGANNNNTQENNSETGELPQELQPKMKSTVYVDSKIHLHKNSVKLLPYSLYQSKKPNNEDINNELVEESENENCFILSFKFDCLVPCEVRIFLAASERKDKDNNCIAFKTCKKQPFIQSHEHIPKKIYSKAPGFNQTFVLPPNYAIDILKYKKNYLHYNEKKHPFRFPLVIEIREKNKNKKRDELEHHTLYLNLVPITKLVSKNTNNGSDEHKEDDTNVESDTENPDVHSVGVSDNLDNSFVRSSFEGETSVLIQNGNENVENEANVEDIENSKIEEPKNEEVLSKTVYGIRPIYYKVQLNKQIFLLGDIYAPETSSNHLASNNTVAPVATVASLEEEEEDNTEQDEDNCVICLSNNADTIVLPCRHECICNECASDFIKKSNKCPICRSYISTTIQL